MFNIIFSNKYFNTLIIALLAIIVSCNKKFDEPPINADPDIPVTLSIKDLKSRYQAPGMFQRITDEQTISGVVVADDRSGNFFKQIVIQDETGGVTLSLDMNSLYSRFPVGRKVFVKLKGLMLGDYGGTIQIGLDSTRSSDGRFLNLVRIPQPQIDGFLIPGSYGNVITPKIVKPSDFTGSLLDPLLNTLIQINNAEFRDADLVKTYANAASPTTESARNFTIKPCDDNKSIVLRNSSYATFAGLTVPQGNGALVGISSVFNGTVQIAIRDTFDVQFKGQRCSGQTPVTTNKTIAEVLAYAKGDSTIPAGTWIEGVIVSDTKNEAAGNYRLQDATAGIQLRFTTAGNPAAAMGDKYSVYVGGLKLSQFNGGLQVNNVETSNKTGTGTITPKTATIADIITAGRTWESQVVTIKDVTITGSGSNYIIKDATGEITTFVRTNSGIVMPTGAASITGYVSIYQAANATTPTVQLTLRTQADIVGGTNNPPPTEGTFNATFDFAGVTATSGVTDPTTLPNVAGITFTAFKAVGAGANSSGPGRFSFNGWPLGATNGSNTFTGAIDPAIYYETTITPDAGKTFDLSTIVFTLQRSGTGIRQYAVRSSKDNFASNLPASISGTNANLSVVTGNIFQVTDAVTNAQEGSTITLSSDFTNLSSAITIRFYGFNAEASGGTFSIDNVVLSGNVK